MCALGPYRIHWGYANFRTSHYALTLGLGDKLFLAPLDKDKVQVKFPFSCYR